jgi:hypothetical protein
LRFFLVLYHSNIIIAFAAAAMTYQTALHFNIPFNAIQQPTMLLAASSFVFYGLHDYYTKVSTGIYHPSAQRQRFWQQFASAMALPLLIGLGVMVYCFYQLIAEPSIVLYVACGLLALCYSFPLAGNTLKSNALAKLLLLAGVWTLTTTLMVLPMPWWWHSKTLIFLTWRFCFLLLLCIPFDVRDAMYDQPQMGRTLVDVFGIGLLVKMCLYIYFVSLICITILVWVQQVNGAVAIGIAVHLAYTCWLAICSIRQPGSDQLYGWLDAQMVVGAIIIGACKWFY